MDFGDIAKKINAENIAHSEKPPEAEPMKAVLDNSDTIERLEQTRKMLIEDKERANSDELGKNIKSTAKSDQKTKTYSEQGYQSGYGGYGTSKSSSYYSSTASKEDVLRDKATKFAHKCFEDSRNRVNNESNNSKWNVVDIVNNERAKALKTPEENIKYARKQRMKESFYRTMISVCTSVIETLYLSKNK